jgi:hypothetical protein
MGILGREEIMDMRVRSIVKAILVGGIAFGAMFNSACAQQPNVAQQTADPNFPEFRGDLKLDPNPEGALLISYLWGQSDHPDIQMFMNNGQPVSCRI